MHLDQEQAQGLATFCIALGGGAYKLWKDRRKGLAEEKAKAKDQDPDESVATVLREEITYLRSENAKLQAQIATLYNALDSGFRRGKPPKEDALSKRPPEPDV